MTCGAHRLLFDYYCEKHRESCPARLLRFFFKMPKICAIPIKPLHCKAFRLDGLITPTHRAAGSSPVGRTKMNDPTQFEQVDETCGSGRVVLHLKSLGMTVFFEDIIPKRI